MNRLTRRSASLVVGIAGGSASGKTAVARQVVRALGEEKAAVVPHDAYYRDLSHMPLEERRRVNVDHPDSLENDLMVEDLRQLIAGDPIALPVYDYSTHVRLDDRRIVEPAPVVIVEGILVLALDRLRRLMDLKVYVHVPEAERLARRLARDVQRRGRTPESVRMDHEVRVQPMHREFVGPSRDHADVVIQDGGHNADAIDRLVAEIRRTLT